MEGRKSSRNGRGKGKKRIDLGKMGNGSVENPLEGGSKSSPEETEKRIKADLGAFREMNKCCKHFGLCSRCQLRYLGELYSSDTFSLGQDEVNKVSASIVHLFFLLK